MSYTLKKQAFLDRESIYNMLEKEAAYSSGWSKGKESQNPNFPDHVVSSETGQAFSMSDFKDFAMKYIREAELAYAGYCPDLRAVRIRFLKAASLLVTALQVYGEPEDLQDIAGVSSTKFPINHGGLKDFIKAEEE